MPGWSTEAKWFRCNYFHSARCWELVSFPCKYSRERQNAAKDAPKEKELTILRGRKGAHPPPPCLGTAWNEETGYHPWMKVGGRGRRRKGSHLINTKHGLFCQSQETRPRTAPRPGQHPAWSGALEFPKHFGFYYLI